MIKILAFPFKYPLKASLKILVPTLASIEARGSSNKYKSASLYKQRAKETLALCPPLKFPP